jgi:hypothetical protein
VIAVVDNDIVCKCCCYQLLFEVIDSLEIQAEMVGVLGTARFVVAKRIKRSGLLKDPSGPISELDGFLAKASVVEPTDVEQFAAADLEFAAQVAGLPLDVGESQLCAITLERSIPLLLTGDKQAIESLEGLLPSVSGLAEICGKVKCLEQVILGLLNFRNPDTVWNAICNEQHVDKALTYALGCSRAALDLEEAIEGLVSYINAIRQAAPRVLAT